MERSLVWNGLISTGFCFCLVNMSFFDRSDFTFCAKLPSDEETPLPYVLSWMQVVHRELARVFAKSCGGFFKGRFWGVFREKVFSSAAATPCWALLPREDREARRLNSGDVLALLRQCRPQPGLQLLDEFHRRERRRGGCSGTSRSAFGWSQSKWAAVHWRSDAALEWHCQGGLVARCVARPVPHRAGSLAAFARPEPSAHRRHTQAGPVSATWAGAGYR